MPAISAFGLLGNIASIHVLRNRHGHLDLNSNFADLLICLAVSDSMFLVLANTVYAVTAILLPRQSALQMMAIPYLLPLTNMSLTGSVYAVVAVTIERYTTLQGNSEKHPWKGKALIAFIVSFSILYNVVKFFELTVDIHDFSPGTVDSKNFTESLDNFLKEPHYVINATWLRRHPVYSLNYIVLGNFFVMNLLPVAVITILNYLIYNTIARATVLHNTVSNHHRRDTTMVALLFSIVIIFLLCHSTRLGLNIYEAVQMLQYGTIQHWPGWADNLTRWNHLMLVINSSSNIVIYVAKDFKFRKALWFALTCRKIEDQHRRRSRSITMTLTTNLANTKV